MSGKLASEQQAATSGQRWNGIAPQVLAGLLAASIACAISASAKASTGSAQKFAGASALSSKHDRPAMGHAVRSINPVASDETAELLQSKLAPAPELVSHWTFRDLLGQSALVGAASTYNPAKPDDRSGGIQTSSGEIYEANAWAAAIQIDLRHAFGGVRYGRNYRPAFALVTIGEKCAVVKINDVGPLRPGRIIDLTERTMRYFDATMQRGVLADAKVTPLEGLNWRSGPLEEGPALPMAGDLLAPTLH